MRFLQSYLLTQSLGARSSLRNNAVLQPLEEPLIHAELIELKNRVIHKRNGEPDPIKIPPERPTSPLGPTAKQENNLPPVANVEPYVHVDPPAAPAQKGDDPKEAPIVENPQSPTKGIILGEESTVMADGPQPIDKMSPDWGVADALFQNVLEDVNKKREENGYEKLQSIHNNWVLKNAWEKVESDSEGYKFCTKAIVNGEEEFAILDIGTKTDEKGNMSAKLNSVTPPDAILGEKTVAKLEAQLPPGIDYGDNKTTIEKMFPCFKGMKEPVARVMDPMERSGAGHGTGLIQEGTTSQFGLLHLGDLGLAAKKHSTGTKQFPEAYDSRAAYPNCALPVRDQGSCGSCYAFATTSTIGERLCIERSAPAALIQEEKEAAEAHQKWETTKYREEKGFSHYKRNRKFSEFRQNSAPIAPGEVLSTQELVSCGSSDYIAYETPYCLRGPGGIEITKYSNGCDGASLLNSLFYVYEYGLPLEQCNEYISGGGNYEDHFDVPAGHVPTCDVLASEACHAQRSQNRVGPPVKCPSGDVDCIKEAIYNKGPVMASMMVCESFMSLYRDDLAANGFVDGVYVKPQGPDSQKGGHAVSLHGWGKTEAGVPFWWGRNSWGTNWGIGGLFKIMLGTNELDIEKEVHFPESHDPNAASPPDSECILVETFHADGVENGEVVETADCTLTNVCPDEVRAVTVSYLGSHENCGSFTATIPEMMPGQSNSVAFNGAHMCRIKHDEHVKAYDANKYYQDSTHLFGGDYPCVLKNTAPADQNRAICCGNACAQSPTGSLALFPPKFCESTGECTGGVTEMDL